MTRIVLVASVSRSLGIGCKGELLFRFPEDQRHFRAVTMGHPVVMGRKTWDSLPERFRPLPGRRNIVVTRQPGWQSAGAEVAHSLQEALALVDGAERASVIGGGDLFVLALPLAHELVMTEVDADPPADARFPRYRDTFTEKRRESHVTADGLHYDFVTYERR
jgi:dihydrofolate reductase